MEQKLFEITLVACKTFFVKAESKEDALAADIVREEEYFSGTVVKWEVEETRVEEVEPGNYRERVLTHESHLIFTDDEV